MISVIVPVYNISQYISDCLDSLSAQTFRDFEAIFVDDCGKDDSIEIIRKRIYSPGFPNSCIIRHENNRGLSAARNTGLEAAKGEFVYFLDGDDCITPDCLEKLHAKIVETDSDIVIGGVKIIDENGDGSEICLKEGCVDIPVKGYALGDWYVMAWNKLCKRSFLLKNNLLFHEGLIHEDVLWSFTVACCSPIIYLIKDSTYIYKCRQNSIMTSLSIKRDANIYIQVFDLIHKYIIDNGLTHDPWVYYLTEGKKSGILYSLLQKGEAEIYNECYKCFRLQNYISPLKAYKERLINIGYLFRDLHYMLPVKIGLKYKAIFYLFVYKIWGRKIEGTVWN